MHQGPGTPKFQSFHNFSVQISAQDRKNINQNLHIKKFNFLFFQNSQILTNVKIIDLLSVN